MMNDIRMIGFRWFAKKSSKTNHFLQNTEKVEINNLEVEEKVNVLKINVKKC